MFSITAKEIDTIVSILSRSSASLSNYHDKQMVDTGEKDLDTLKLIKQISEVIPTLNGLNPVFYSVPEQREIIPEKILVDRTKFEAVCQDLNKENL